MTFFPHTPILLKINFWLLYITIHQMSYTYEYFATNFIPEMYDYIYLISKRKKTVIKRHPVYSQVEKVHLSAHEDLCFYSS